MSRRLFVIIVLLISAMALNHHLVFGQPQPSEFVEAFVSGGNQGLLNPAGVAFGPDGHIYASSPDTRKVLRYNGVTGEFIDVFVDNVSRASGLVFGPDSNLYISSKDLVLRYDGVTGLFIDIFVGPDKALEGSTVGLVFGPDGNLYISTAVSHRVLRFDGLTGEFIDKFVTSGSGNLESPAGLAFGPDNNLYVASRGGHQIIRFDGVDGSFIDRFVTAKSGGLRNPYNILFGPDNDLYITHSGSNSLPITHTVLRYDGVTGAYKGSFAKKECNRCDNFRSMALGPDNNFYFSVGNQLHRYDGITSDFIDVFVDGKSEGGLNGPTGLTFGPDGNLYVSSSRVGEILRYGGNTGEYIDLFTEQYGPNNLAFGPDGNLYTSNYYNNEILRLDGTTGAFVDTFVVTNTRFRRLESITFGPDGHLYIGGENGSILRYDGSTGEFIDTFVVFGGPFVFGPQNKVYVSDRKKVLRYNSTTRRYIDVFIDEGSGNLDDAKILAFGPDNNLYILDDDGRNILRFNGVSGAFIDTYISSSGDVGDFVFGPDGDLYLTSVDTHEVLRFREATGSTVANEEASFAAVSITAQNYPNPFNTSTTIEYSLPEAGLVKMEVYDILGRVVDLLKNESQPAGTHQVMWETNPGVPSGLYLLRITTTAGNLVLPVQKE